MIHIHLLSLRTHSSHGWLELLLGLLLGQASSLNTYLHRIHTLQGWVGVNTLLTGHGRWLKSWLSLRHARLSRERLWIGVGILGSPLLDKCSQQLGVGVKDTKHLLLL